MTTNKAATLRYENNEKKQKSDIKQEILFFVFKCMRIVLCVVRVK